MYTFLDKPGLTYFWGKIKAVLDLKANSDDLADVAMSGNYKDLSGVPVVDETLSASSENAIQNKAVYEKFSALEDALTTI